MDLAPEILLHQLPEKPHRSKLEPYGVFIRGLRQKRYTYQEIADLLATHYNLRVDPSTVFDFFKRRRNRSDVPLVSTAVRHEPSAPSTSVDATALPRSTPPPQFPLSASTPNVPHKRFHYDPEEGLTLSEQDLNLKPRKD